MNLISDKTIADNAIFFIQIVNNPKKQDNILSDKCQIKFHFFELFRSPVKKQLAASAAYKMINRRLKLNSCIIFLQNN